MKLAGLGPAALLPKLRRGPPGPRPPRPAAADREPGGRAGAKARLVALPGIGEEEAVAGPASGGEEEEDEEEDEDAAGSSPCPANKNCMQCSVCGHNKVFHSSQVKLSISVSVSFLMWTSVLLMALVVTIY